MPFPSFIFLRYRRLLQRCAALTQELTDVMLSPRFGLNDLRRSRCGELMHSLEADGGAERVRGLVSPRETVRTVMRQAVSRAVH